MAVTNARLPRRRARAQSLVEVALAFPLLILAGTGVIQFSLWMHAQGVITAAVQDGARVASSETGTLADGQAAAAALLRDGLGPSAPLVRVVSTEDATAVRFEASGSLPAIFPWGPVTAIPVHATALMGKDRFIP
jgi:Flp pilus assembly protein TadG